MDSPIAARLTALRRLNILETEPESSFDSLVSLAAQIFAAPFSAFSLLDGERQWFKARVGIEPAETPIDISFCTHALASGEPVYEILDAAADHRFDANPLVWGETRLRYYAGAAIHSPTGEPIGTLCVLDSVPRGPMTALARSQMRSLADAIEDALRLRAELELRRETEARLSQSEASYRMLANHCHDILRSEERRRLRLRGPSCRRSGGSGQPVRSDLAPICP